MGDDHDTVISPFPYYYNTVTGRVLTVSCSNLRSYPGSTQVYPYYLMTSSISTTRVFTLTTTFTGRQ